MRISTKAGDPGYSAWQDAIKKGLEVKIFLNGVERIDVITADEQNRLIVKSRRDGDGNFVLSPDRSEILTEVMRGDVRIELSEPKAENARADETTRFVEPVKGFPRLHGLFGAPSFASGGIVNYSPQCRYLLRDGPCRLVDRNPPSVVVKNVFDPAIVGDFLKTDAAADLVLRILKRNAR